MAKYQCLATVNCKSGTGVFADAKPRLQVNPQVNTCPGFGACPSSRMNPESPRCQACYLEHEINRGGVPTGSKGQGRRISNQPPKEFPVLSTRKCKIMIL